MNQNIILNIDVNSLKDNNILTEYKNNDSDNEFVELLEDRDKSLKFIPSNNAVDYSN